MGLASCGYTECEKRDSCFRYTEDKKMVCVEFKHICRKDNNFQWFCKKDLPIVKEDMEDKNA